MKDIKGLILNYLKETRAETKKVAWPDRQFVVSATMVILFITFGIAFFTMFLDLGLAQIILFLTKAF